MNPQDQHPNPIEDYMRDVMATNTPVQEASVGVASASSGQPQTVPANELMENALKKRKPVFNPTGRIEEVAPNEQKIADIRRHPIGLIIIYIQFFVAAALAIGLLAFLVPSVLGSGAGVQMFLAALVLLMVFVGFIFIVLATRVYRGNQLIITDINVTEVQQLGLFNRKVSELTMANIEDVSANTNGIFQTMFNFGTISVETAGAHENFIFKYCPNPNAYAKVLQDARQAFIESHSELD